MNNFKLNVKLNETHNASTTFKGRSIWALLREMLARLSLRRQRQFVFFLCLMFLGAIAELLSIGAILPFLAVISNPERMVQQAQLHKALETFGITTSSQIIILCAVLFGLAALFAASIRLLIVYVCQRFVAAIAQELSVAVFNRTLHQPYSYHISLNSNESLAAIIKAQMVAEQVLLPLLLAVTASIIATTILMALFFLDPVMALGSGVCFATTYLVVMRTTRVIMMSNGKLIAKAQEERLRAASEGLGGIRDVLLGGCQAVYVARFAAIEARRGSAVALNNFVAQAPRFVVEAVGIVIVAGLAVIVSLREGGVTGSLPLIGALALAAQRLLPLLQQAYFGWASTLSAAAMLANVIDVLNLPGAPHPSSARDEVRLPFKRDLIFSKVSLTYKNGSRAALFDINLSVKRENV